MTAAFRLPPRGRPRPSAADRAAVHPTAAHPAAARRGTAPGPARLLPRAAALAAACCLCALSAAPGSAAAPAAPAAPGGGRGSSGSAAGSVVAALPANRALLSEPGVHVEPQSGAPALPSGISALAWTVSDARTGQVLAAKNAHRQLPPASTLKTLFADTVLPRFPREQTHTVTPDDLAGIGAGSSLVGVQAGMTYTVADLWRGVFLASGNDAVHVLAHMNGSVEQTVRQMQAKAHMLGADDTHVVTPDGYDEPGQVSSAYDLAVFARAGLADPDFADYCATKTAQFPGGYDPHGNFVVSFGIQNTNRLLTGAHGVTPYPDLIGVKNGYTTNAGNTLVAAARRGDRTLIVTVMNPQSGVTNAVYSEAAKLLDWGFDAAGRTTSVGTLNSARTLGFAGTPAHAGVVAEGSVESATAPGHPAGTPAHAPGTARDGSASPTAWYIGGGLAVVAAASVLVLRRRSAAKTD